MNAQWVSYLDSLTWVQQHAQIKLISGHSSKKSLETYQHLGLGSVEVSYQDAMKEWRYDQEKSSGRG